MTNRICDTDVKTSGSPSLPNLIEQVRAFNPTLAADIEAAIQAQATELADFKQWRDNLRAIVEKQRQEEAERKAVELERFGNLFHVSAVGVLFVDWRAVAPLGLKDGGHINIYCAAGGWRLVIHPLAEPDGLKPATLTFVDIAPAVFDELRHDFPAIDKGAVFFRAVDGRDTVDIEGTPCRVYDVMESVYPEAEAE